MAIRHPQHQLPPQICYLDILETELSFVVELSWWLYEEREGLKRLLQNDAKILLKSLWIGNWAFLNHNFGTSFGVTRNFFAFFGHGSLCGLHCNCPQVAPQIQPTSTHGWCLHGEGPAVSAASATERCWPRDTHMTLIGGWSRIFMAQIFICLVYEDWIRLMYIINAPELDVARINLEVFLKTWFFSMFKQLAMLVFRKVEWHGFGTRWIRSCVTFWHSWIFLPAVQMAVQGAACKAVLHLVAPVWRVGYIWTNPSYCWLLFSKKSSSFCSRKTVVFVGPFLRSLAGWHNWCCG